MSQNDIICKATPDTFMRFGIVIAALLGFAAYFFYDGAIGYRSENEQICSFQAFARMGEEAIHASSTEWRERTRKPLLETEQEGDELVYRDKAGHAYPLPLGCEASTTCPPEAQDLEAMQKSWNDCWTAYSQRRHFSIKPAEHGHDQGAIREQWLAGGIFTLLGLGLVYLALRTKGRELALRGDEVTAAGQTFPISAIESIDLRQWGPGFKGVASFRVGGKKIRVDGMTYGGFSRSKGEPAERFMKAVLARYQGEIIDYESTSAKD